MKTIVWLIGGSLQMGGIILVTLALLFGVGFSDMGKEYLLWIIGLIAFFAGQFIRTMGER